MDDELVSTWFKVYPMVSSWTGFSDSLKNKYWQIIEPNIVFDYTNGVLNNKPEILEVRCFPLLLSDLLQSIC